MAAEGREHKISRLPAGFPEASRGFPEASRGFGFGDGPLKGSVGVDHGLVHKVVRGPGP